MLNKLNKRPGISITLPEDLLKYIDDLAAINDRTRSSMIAAVLREYQQNNKEDHNGKNI